MAVLRRSTWMAFALLCGCYRGGDGGAGGDDTDTDASETDGDSGESDGETEADGDRDPLGCGDDASLSPLRRLSEAQYRNTLRDLFEPAGIDIEVEASVDLGRIPADDAGSTFKILDARVSEQHARAYYVLADRIAEVAASDDAHLAAVAGSCAQQASPDDTCIDAFLDDFGLRAYRRPLSETEREPYLAMKANAENGPELFRALVFRLLLSPQFLYHVEVEGAGDDDSFDLDGYALASRLSYHFWQTMPDDELFAAAADGTLETSDGYTAQLDRVFDHPRTQETIDRFYDEWLQLGWITQFPSTPAFETFAEGTTVFDEGADHLAAAQAEIHALARHYTWSVDGSVADLYLSDLSFTQSPHLAALYGVDVWDGRSPPPQMPDDARAGLLTRAAFLITGSHDTHPIHRGAVVRRRLLCEELPSPDPASLPPGALDPPPVDAEQTTRERYEAKTADAACAGCHALLNPVGFVLEQYDALGRLRTEETIIDEVTGEVLATLPIDANAAPNLSGEAVVGSAAELSQQVIDTGLAEACFARQYFRATFGREVEDEDTCAVDAIIEALGQAGSLKEALRTIALAPVFRARRVR